MSLNKRLVVWSLVLGTIMLIADFYPAVNASAGALHSLPEPEILEPEILFFEAPASQDGVPNGMIPEEAPSPQEDAMGARILASTYWVDIKIVYDSSALTWAGGHGLIPNLYFPANTEFALDYGFRQYWSDMDFYASTDIINWCVWDVDGYPSNDPTTILNNWPQEFGWPAWTGGWTRRGTSLPNGQGHGSYFDLLVMFTVNPFFPTTLGWTYRYHNAMIINLAAIVLPSTWSMVPFFGLYSVIMHETGHAYGIVGDTRGVHYDVMDYIWGHIYPYSSWFDSYHQGVVAPYRSYHSA